MMRVTNNIIATSTISNLREQANIIDKLHRKIATGKKNLLPSESPTEYIHSARYRSELFRIGVFYNNTQEAISKLREMDSSLQEVNDILARLKEIAIRASNGTYEKSDLEKMGYEVNELLKEIVRIANQKGSDGKYLFGGSNNTEIPFRAIYDVFSIGRRKDIITRVEYNGDIVPIKKEVSDNEYLEVDASGNKIFWATNQVIETQKASPNYVATREQEFEIDGVRIKVNAGDTLDAIINKINTANVKVRASKGPNGTFILETTTPHQIWVRDIGDGTVLQDLGLIDPNNPIPPNNFAPTVEIGGVSLFEAVIQLRDDLLRGNHKLAGGRDLGAIDSAIDNILLHRAEIGAKMERAEMIAKKLDIDKRDTIANLQREEDVDLPKAIMDLKWNEAVHQYTLSVSARIIKPTLLDYLR
jgi:flagellar hook-associated protein 3 FlgL